VLLCEWVSEREKKHMHAGFVATRDELERERLARRRQRLSSLIIISSVLSE